MFSRPVIRPSWQQSVQSPLLCTRYQVCFPCIHQFTLICTEFNLPFLLPTHSITWNCSAHLSKPLSFQYFSLTVLNKVTSVNTLTTPSPTFQVIIYEDVEQPKDQHQLPKDSPSTPPYWATQSLILAPCFVPLNSSFVYMKNFHLSQFSFFRKLRGGAMLKEV